MILIFATTNSRLPEETSLNVIVYLPSDTYYYNRTTQRFIKVTKSKRLSLKARLVYYTYKSGLYTFLNPLLDFYAVEPSIIIGFPSNKTLGIQLASNLEPSYELAYTYWYLPQDLVQNMLSSRNITIAGIQPLLITGIEDLKAYLVLSLTFIVIFLLFAISTPAVTFYIISYKFDIIVEFS